MQILHLLIEDDYIEEFVSSLPRDKVTIVEKEFNENKKLLQDELEKYNNEDVEIKPYHESMQDLNIWLKEKA
jgi:hypothetical protein